MGLPIRNSLKPRRRKRSESVPSTASEGTGPSVGDWKGWKGHLDGAESAGNPLAGRRRKGGAPAGQEDARLEIRSPRVPPFNPQPTVLCPLYRSTNS